jgi:DNA mismatch repair ATPase MutS
MTPADTSTKDFNLTFTHRVRDGHTTAKNYGLEVAKVAALPPRMLQWAKEATEKLGELEEARRENAKGTKAANRRKILDEVKLLLASQAQY